MNDDQITALAREYAEEMIKGKPSEELPNCLKNSMMAMNTEYIAEVFQWLTRRYCLVEKENIEKCFQSRNYILTHQDEYAVYIVRDAEVEMKLLRCLFPEIAKEVEG